MASHRRTLRRRSQAHAALLSQRPLAHRADDVSGQMMLPEEFPSDAPGGAAMAPGTHGATDGPASTLAGPLAGTGAILPADLHMPLTGGGML